MREDGVCHDGFVCSIASSRWESYASSYASCCDLISVAKMPCDREACDHANDPYFVPCNAPRVGCISASLAVQGRWSHNLTVAHVRNLGKYKQKAKTYNRRDSQMVTHSSTSRPVQCLCMAERTGCPVFTDLWSYVLGLLHLCYM